MHEIYAAITVVKFA